MMVPVSGALAATTGTNQTTQPASEEQASKEISDVGSNADYDARSQSEGGYGRFAKQILGASTAIIGANIISQCSFGGKVPSILAFMGGSIAYLVSELAGGKKQNEEHKQRLEKIEQIKKMVAENKGGGDVQRELIEQRLEEEKKILQFVKERSMWGAAIMAIYIAAAALAIKEEMSGKAAGKAAGVSTCAGLAAQYASPCGPKYAACYRKHFSACKKVAPAGEMAAKAAFMSPASVATGQAACGIAALYAPACQANLTTYLGIAFANCQPLGLGNISVAGFSTNLFSAAYGIGFGMASSDKLQLYLQLAVSLTGLFTKTITTKITALYSYPIPRGVTFAAHAATMGVIIMGLKQVQAQTEKNVEELTKVVNNFRKETDDESGIPQGSGLANGQTPGGQTSGGLAGNTSGSGSSAGAGAGGSSTLPNSNLNTLPPGIVTTGNNRNICLTNQSGMEISNSACKNSLKVNPIKFGFNDSDRNLDTSVKLINDLNRSVEEGNLDSARATAGELASMALKLKDDLGKLQNSYNDELKKESIAKYDFENAEKLRSQELEEGKQDVYDDFEKNSGIKVASLAPSSSVGTSEVSSSNVDPASQITEASTDKALGLPTGIDLSKVEAGLNDQVGSGVDDPSLLYGGNTSSNNPDGLNDDAYNAALANGYLPLNGKKNPYVGDGVSDSEANIFKNISKRYFLSYPRFFKKKEIQMTNVK